MYDVATVKAKTILTRYCSRVPGIPHNALPPNALPPYSNQRALMVLKIAPEFVRRISLLVLEQRSIINSCIRTQCWLNERNI